LHGVSSGFVVLAVAIFLRPNAPCKRTHLRRRRVRNLVIVTEIDQKRRGKRYKTATPVIISGQIVSASRDRRGIGGILPYTVRANGFSSKAFRT
jgi:hypothetical protein